MLAVAVAAILWFWLSGPRSGHVYDEAMQAGLTAEHFNPIASVDPGNDYFHDMDQGVQIETKSEINGRNMWILWSGGDDRFWDLTATLSFGNVDFLKTLSSYQPDSDPALDPTKKEELKKIYKFRRNNRWDYLGVVNEPCFEQSSGPNKDRFGLWLDTRSAGCGPDPFEDEAKYPGVRIGARGKNLPVGSYYGYASGVVGLRLFANPAFDEAAAKKWDPVRFYTDANYYKSKDLIRPYRAGMSCGFCHIGPNPVNPPADPENPKWENLSSNVGAQYLWLDRIFSWDANPQNYLYQLFQSWRPGTLDPSFVSTDNINNPRTMNAVYSLDARMRLAKEWGKERMSGGNLDNRQLNDYVPAANPLAGFFQAPDTVWTMRVLKDGSDSIGVMAALNRVYLNIGLFSEEWLLHFRPLVGGKRTTPIEVKTVRKNSVYWQATEAQTFDMAAFLLKCGKPHRLKEITSKGNSPTPLNLGKRVFAERCARCHSSKLPPPPVEANPVSCTSGNYLDCWNRYWQWTKTEGFKEQARRIVSAPDFLENNYLSTDLRVPVTLLQTKACSPLATNGIAGNIWDNFTSETYKQLPAVGKITYYQPFTGEARTFEMPGGGRGYTRPPSLVSLWSTAPFLLNNSVGPFDPSPSVEARLKSFQSSIEQMLWPERREKDSLLGDRIPGTIDRTTAPTYLRVPAGYLSDFVRPLLAPAAFLLPTFVGGNGPERGVALGPFPSGMPVELLSNIQLALDYGGIADQFRLNGELMGAVLKLNSALKAAKGKTDEEARGIVFAPEVIDSLLKVSKCPDYIANRGHYFGTSYLAEEPALSDGEKRALIAFLKTF